MNNDPLPRPKAPDLLLHLVDRIAATLMAQGGLTQEAAYDLSLSLVDEFALLYGGQRVYIPAGTWNGGRPWHELAERDWQIYREYVGANRDELCARYGISRQRLYQIIAAVRRRRKSTLRPVS